MGFLQQLFGLGGEQAAETGKGQRTSGGSTVLRHDTLAADDGIIAETPYAEAIQAHFNETFPGRETFVIPDEEAKWVKVDVAVMRPTEEEPYYVLYTLGMSARPMTLDNMPHGKKFDYLRTAELMAYLPASWPVESLRESSLLAAPKEISWPVRLLKNLARMPHAHATWLGGGHSIPNGAPPHPYATNTPFEGVVLFPPAEGDGPKGVLPVQLGNKKANPVLLYLMAPVYPEEMALKLRKGADVLEETLRGPEGGAGFIIDNTRPCLVQKEEEEE